jgi:hypothetical protein
MKGWLSWLTVGGLVVVACGVGDPHEDGLDVVLLDEASDEVLITLIDATGRGEVTADDDRAAHLTSPVDGAELPLGSAARFSWEAAQLTTYHGRSTGDFVWARIDCPGMGDPIDILALETMSWLADANHWAKIGLTTGACTVTVTTAFVDRGVIQEGGPFRPTSHPTFSLRP